MKVVVASKNPVKIAAVEAAFEKFFESAPEVISMDAPSGVKAQPVTDKETREGSLNRAIFVREQVPEADFWIGLEAGIEEKDHGTEMFGWVSVLSLEKISAGKTATAMVPEEIADLLRQGMEMGAAADQFFSKEDIKHKEGLIGILTNGLVDRRGFLEEAVIMALIPFRA